MFNTTKIAVLLLLLAAAVGGAFYLMSAPPPVVPPIEVVDDEFVADDPPPIDPVEVASSARVDEELVRTRASDPASEAHTGAPQGVQGRVLLPTGAAAVGVTVVLVQNATLDLLATFLNNRMGRVPPPLATATTADDGSFALGILRPGKAVDLRVVSDAYPEIERTQIEVRRDDWYDAGDLVLEQGLVVQGRVLDAGSKLPVEGAMVFMNASRNSHARIAIPGRERGVPMQVDSAGYFRFENAPRLGLVNLVVEAGGYASANLLRQQLQRDAPNDFTIEIERGRTITGVVVDKGGARIANAKVTARGLSSKTSQTETVRCDEAGEFEFPTLRHGPYQLMVSAARFAEATVPLAMTDEDVKVVLTRLGSVKLRVLTADNRPVRAYRLSLKRVFPNNPAGIGNVIGFADRNINPRNYPAEYQGQWAVIDGLSTGDYRFQLSERRHAKTLSPVFTIEAGSDVVEVTAVLTLGASITGTVIDDRGNPIANARVTTDRNGGLAADLGGLQKIFRAFIPEKHTTKNTRTDQQGRFRIDRLSFADYMLRVSHEQYCEGRATDIELQSEGQVVDSGVILLARGAILEGTTSVAGQFAGQIEVVVSTPLAEGGLTANAPAAEGVRFHARAISDGNGSYRLLQRVPPGTYKITASRSANGNPFYKLVDMKESERQLVVTAGQDVAQMDFNLSGR